MYDLSCMVFLTGWHTLFGKTVREAAKKSLFLVARPHRPYGPLELSGHIFWEFFFRASNKVIFLSCQALIPPSPFWWPG